MDPDLSANHCEARERFRSGAEAFILPAADRIDAEESIPREVIARLAANDWLGAGLPEADGGMDALSLGLLCEEVGRVSSSVRSLLTVQGMVGQAVARWGSPEQRDRWLLPLRDGRAIGAFALTEPNVGSDARAVETSVRLDGRRLIVQGRKKWISFAQIADVFLIAVQLDGRPTIIVLERETPGLSIEPIRGMLGDRGAMLAQVVLNECEIHREDILGRVGLGISHVAATALDAGRHSLAWGCVGVARACLEDSMAYASERRQFGVPIGDHQLVRRLLARMHVNLQAARLLCLKAAYRRIAGDPEGISDALAAKYFASQIAYENATNAVQIHGAIGCSRERRVERYLRDAKITELIEGSTQIQELLIGQHILRDAGRSAARSLEREPMTTASAIV